MMASQPATTASLERREESQDSQLILEALRAELGVPSVSATAEPQRPQGLQAWPDPCKRLARQQKPGCGFMEPKLNCWSARLQRHHHSKANRVFFFFNLNSLRAPLFTNSL